MRQESIFNKREKSQYPFLTTEMIWLRGYEPNNGEIKLVHVVNHKFLFPFKLKNLE